MPRCIKSGRRDSETDPAVRILFLPRYGPQGASSRYRIWQYIPLFERVGHEVEARPLLNDGYLAELYTTGRRGWCWLARGYASRMLGALSVRNFDLLICEHEIFPFLPAAVEKVFVSSNNRLIIDYDDAPYVKYKRWPILRNKIPRRLAAAAAVVTGNSHLAEYALRFTRNVTIIPTVINLANYTHRNSEDASGAIRIVWIGTPVTAYLLQSLIPAFTRLQIKYPAVQFHFIGAGNGIDCSGLRAKILKWSEITETELISQCQIGVMPLGDTEFTRGKCGLKLIQYMACGLPVVASPVGVNCEIVEENKNGFLASTHDEWYEKLERLIRDTSLRKRLGKAGRATVTDRYTLELGFAKWLKVLETIQQPIGDGSFHVDQLKKLYLSQSNR